MTNEPKTQAGRALLAKLLPTSESITAHLWMLHDILAIEAEKDEEYERVVDFYRKQRDEAAAAPAAQPEAIRLLRQAHRGDWCQLPGEVWDEIDHFLASDPAAAEPPDHDPWCRVDEQHTHSGVTRYGPHLWTVADAAQPPPETV